MFDKPVSEKIRVLFLHVNVDGHDRPFTFYNNMHQ